MKTRTTAAERVAAEQAALVAKIEKNKAARVAVRTLRERSWLRLNPERMPGQ